MSDPSGRGSYQRSGLYGTLAGQPGLLISMSYLLLSLLGMFFTWSLYQRLGVDYLEFAEVSDFLMAVLREPATLLMAASAVLVTLLLRGIVKLEQRYFARHPPGNALTRAYSRVSAWSHRNLALEAAIFVLYSFLFVTLYGDWKSERLKDGHGRQVRVQLVEGGEPAPRILLGGSSRYLFLFDPASGRVEATPHENILRLDMLVSAETARPEDSARP